MQKLLMSKISFLKLLKNRLKSVSKCKICQSKITKKDQPKIISRLNDELLKISAETQSLKASQDSLRQEKDLYFGIFLVTKY